MTKFESQNAPEPVGLYPHAKQVGDLLFLSGIGPRERGKKDIPGVELDQNGNIISYDIAVQCHSVFKNVRTVLEDAGSSWDNLVDVTVFLTNMKEDFEMVEIPKITGITVRQARKTIESLGFVFGEIEYVDDIARDEVISITNDSIELKVGDFLKKTSIIDFKLGNGKQ